MKQKLHFCVVIGGAGAVGNMFVALLVNSGREVFVIDKHSPNASVQFEIGDITAPGPDVLQRIKGADLVLLALPERVALAALLPVMAAMSQGALLAHTLSVQSPIAEVIQANNVDVEVVGLNPMFAPALSMTDRSVAAIVLKDGPRVHEILQLVSAQGARVVRLNADEHDRLTAATQVLTHAVILSFGLALADFDVDISLLRMLAPPPHATLLALLARIVSGTPAVYWDIQSANPHASAARAALARSIECLLAGTKDEVSFSMLLQKGRQVLDTELGFYQDTCAHIFNGHLSLTTHDIKQEEI